MRTLALLLALAFVTSPASAHVLLPTDPKLPPLALKHHRVEIAVTNGTAVTTIEQVYVNSTSRQLEATYLFPLPKDAVVVDFELMVNGTMKKGEVLEKDKADRIYTDIVRRMRDPGIVDWMGRGLFRARIYPVPPRGEQKLRITYSQVLPFVDGIYHLSYPMRAPRQTLSTLQDFTLTARIEHSVPIKNVYSPSHRIAVSRPDDHKAVVGFEADRVSLDKDFSLYFGVSDKDVGLNLLTHRVAGEAGYFMLMAAPKAVFNTAEIQGKSITFVLDTSGSMTGLKLEQARKALQWSLDQLGPDDRFNVIRFSSDVERFEPELVTASDANKARAKAFVGTFEAAGGTAISDALSAALSSAPRKGGPHLVLFITDGRPTVGETAPKAILAGVSRYERKGARIFALGIGDDVHTHLLDQLADDNGGTSAYVKPSEDMNAHIAALYNQIAYPVLSDVALNISKVRIFAAQPGKLPDIFKGGQLTLIGRYRGEGDALITLSGRMGQMSRSFDFEGTFPERRADNSFITSLWAHRQVGFLLDQIRLKGETAELKAEVIQLAKKYGIVTPYTSYLVVEDRTVGQPRPPVLPVPIPRPPPRPHFDGGHGHAPRAGASSRAPAPAQKMPSPSHAEEERMMLELAASDDLNRDKSGRSAVDTAKAVRQLKNKDQAGSPVDSVRYASGRVFSWRGGGWVDNAVRAGSREVRVAPFSDGWIALVRALPQLKQALSLGESVTIRLGRYTIIVEPGAAKKVDGAILKDLRSQ